MAHLGRRHGLYFKRWGSANGSGDRSGVDNEWNTYTWTADAIELVDDWNTYYQAINRANTLIDMLGNSSISEDAVAKIDGQTKFLRALMYFDLVKMFGAYHCMFEALRTLAKPINHEVLRRKYMYK